MNNIESVNYSIKVMNNSDEHPYNSHFSFFDEYEEYPLKKVYCNPSYLSRYNNFTIIVGNYIYDAEYEYQTIYETSINGDNEYVLKKIPFESEEKLMNEIEMQNRASEFGLSDPVIFAYVLENEKECGLIMKRYDEDLFSIFDSDYYDLEDKKSYLHKIKKLLEDLVDKVNISHGNFNLENIMIDDKGELKLVSFGNSSFIGTDDDLKKHQDFEKFSDYGLKLNFASESVTLDLEEYWYEINN